MQGLQELPPFQKYNFFSSNPNQLTVRKATKNDLIALSAIAKTTYQETYKNEGFTDEALEQLFGFEALSKQFENPDITFYVAFNNYKLCGYIKVEQLFESLLLDKIYLLENFQGKGFGAQLLNSAFQHAVEHDNNTMELKVYCKNHRAIQFYKKQGFVHTETSDYIAPNGDIMPKAALKLVCDDIKAHNNVVRFH